MDFGRVNSFELDTLDFTLPPDHPATAAVVKKGKNKTVIHIGCTRWGTKEWVGKLFPPKTKEVDYLSQYARHFNSIELNATFYRMPTPSQVVRWKNKVGSDFKFCPKLVDQITHFRRLKNVKELTDQFLEAMAAFDQNLGPIFLVPHPQMGPQSLETLHAFIESLPTDVKLFVELRHPQWFSNPNAFEAAFSLFTKLKAGSIITDASGRRDCLHMRLTTPEAFIRFVGNGLHPSDYARINDWVQRIKHWIDLGIEDIWFFMHQQEELHSPQLCSYLITEINQHCHTSIPEIRFIPSTGLFD
jgi:uncharacterized protein YecE (DUF72 family)